MENTTTSTGYINLVPLGLIVIAVYHACLLRRIIHRPTSSLAAINRQFLPPTLFTEKQGTVQNRALAVQTLLSRITAAAMTAWAGIMLGSSIAILAIKARWAEQSPGMLGRFGLVAYLIAAFLLSVQTGRYYRHASILIAAQARCRGKYDVVVMNRGLCFRAMGLRACFLAVPLYLWLFGAIIMFAGCFVMVVMMHVVDTRYDWSEGEEKAVFEESAKDVAEHPQSVSRRHDGVISRIELLEIIVVKN